MKGVRGKKGIDFVYSTVIFLLANGMFFAIFFLAVGRSGSTAGVYEEAFAKEIALTLDSAKPGTVLEFDISRLISIGRDKNLEPKINLDCDTGEVSVKVTPSGGYAQKYFTKFETCSSSIDMKGRKFIVKT